MPTKPKEREKGGVNLIRLGDDNLKTAIPKPKHWSFITPKEGRKGKQKKSKDVKLTNSFWKAKSVVDFLLASKAGVPECNWTISTNSPFRTLTSRDVCYVLQGLQKHPLDLIEVKFNNPKRVFIIEDCSKWIKSGGEEPLASEMMNK